MEGLGLFSEQVSKGQHPKTGLSLPRPSDPNSEPCRIASLRLRLLRVKEPSPGAAVALAGAARRRAARAPVGRTRIRA